MQELTRRRSLYRKPIGEQSGHRIRYPTTPMRKSSRPRPQYDAVER